MGSSVGDAVQERAPAEFRFVKRWESVSAMNVVGSPWFRWLNQIPIRWVRNSLFWWLRL